MVIAHPVSNSDNLSNETLHTNQDGIVINSNSLESVPSLVSDVRSFVFYHLFSVVCFEALSLSLSVRITRDKYLVD